MAESKAPPRPVRFGRALAWVMGSYAVSTVAQLALLAVAGRLLDLDDFGAFAGLTASVGVISQLGLFGAQVLALRESAVFRDHEHDSPVRREGLERHASQIRTVTWLLLPAVSLVAGGVLALVFADSPRAAWVLGAGAVFLVFTAGQQKLYANYMRGFGDVKISSFLEGRNGGAILLVSQAVALGVLFLLEPHVHLATAVAVIAVAGVPGAVVGWVRTRRYFHGVAVQGWRPLAEARELGRRTRSYAASQVGLFLDQNVELYVALAVLSAADSSEFAAAQRVALLVVLPQMLIQIVVSPVVARLRGRPRQMESTIRTVATFGTFAGLLLVVPLVVAPQWIVPVLFGGDFDGASTALAILAAGYFLRVVTGLGPITLSMTDHAATLARILWAGSALRVVAGVAAGLAFGAEGLATSAALVTVVVCGVLVVTTRRLTGVRTLPTLRPRVRTLLSTFA